MDRIIAGLVDDFQKEYALTDLSESETFEAFAAYCVLHSFYDDDFDPDLFRTGGGNDLGIDAMGVLLNGHLLCDADRVRSRIDSDKQLDVRFVLIQAKTSTSFDAKVISDLADNLDHITQPGKLPYAASPDIANLRECLDAVYANIAKLAGSLPELHVYYVTTGERVADFVAKKAQSARDRLARLARFDRVEFHCVTRDELRRLYRQATTRVAVQFAMPRKVPLPKAPDVAEALMGLLPARDLVEKILSDGAGRLRKTLFHGNVRDYLGDDNAVNREIRDTLADPVRRERFAVLNNGITIVTRGLRVVGDDVYLNDFQIVNGCQTCHVLFDTRDQLTDGVQVSVRIVHSHDEDVIDGIVGATNRQTVISEEDLTVRARIHHDLEAYFASAVDQRRRLYYERRSKQYVDRKEIEKTRVITRAQLTRSYVAMFLDEPGRFDRARSSAARSGHLFADNHQPAVYYAAASAFYRLDWLLRNGRIDTSYRRYRFHLLAAIKLRLLGPAPVQHTNQKTTERACKPIVDAMWDQWEAERLVVGLLTPLDRAIAAAPGVPGVPDAARTQRFARLVHQEVLGTS